MDKTFKLIPRLTNWEDILDVMSPDKWSAAAMFQATRMFASNMSEGSNYTDGPLDIRGHLCSNKS